MVVSAVALIAATLNAADRQATIPPRPETLSYPPLRFDPPKASEFRTKLSDGTSLYMIPSHDFPLITLSISCMGGSNLDPADRVGLAGMTAAMIRRGGTLNKSADEVDEDLEFMATNLGVRSAEWTTSASIDCLKSNFDASLAILIDLLRNPKFDEAKFAIAKSDAFEALKQRNDDAASISAREWGYLVGGEDHFESRQPTGAGIEAISDSDMREMAARIFHPGNMIITITGDFDPKTMPATIEKALEGWKPGARNAPPVGPTHEMTPGVYFVQKDIPQGKVSIGLRAIRRDDPDFYAYTVMNDILGGGGFSSRIMTRVRSDEGLAYSAGSSFRPGAFYPGVFRAAYESKSPTVALAAKLIFEEFDRMRNQPVTSSELEISKNSFIETFPNTFASKAGTLGVFVSDEWTNRPTEFWETFRDKIRAVTPEQIQAVAQKYLKPSQMTILIVGNWPDIAKGDLQGRANMQQFGKATQLPMRDPISLQPIQTPNSDSDPAPKPSATNTTQELAQPAKGS